MTTTTVDVRAVLGEPEYERRMEAARARAEWELGDASWAGVILAAFLHPDEDARNLADEVAS